MGGARGKLRAGEARQMRGQHVRVAPGERTSLTHLRAYL